ncbi:hypothetical protein KUTeg_011249 [Tegillarca granosa]|uniref:Uncharacterized protein n=1 Tax=Tegillarca granosa TaxID=220873 RepID=A0ABQ9F1B4_TEGGR|nr:hypothetical protein KUTeg_011249 [Tegillarca granosa]
MTGQNWCIIEIKYDLIKIFTIVLDMQPCFSLIFNCLVKKGIYGVTESSSFVQVYKNQPGVSVSGVIYIFYPPSMKPPFFAGGVKVLLYIIKLSDFNEQHPSFRYSVVHISNCNVTTQNTSKIRGWGGGWWVVNQLGFISVLRGHLHSCQVEILST